MEYNKYFNEKNKIEPESKPEPEPLLYDNNIFI